MRPEPRGTEGGQNLSARWKNGLETPLEGRFWRETRLVFAPPVWYDVLTWGCVAMGAWGILSLFVPGVSFLWGFWMPFWRLVLGALLLLAGLWGQFSSERMTVDLKARQWARREGQGLFKRSVRGRLDEIDAVVATTEIYPLQAGLTKVVVYRLVVHWKGQRHPLMVVMRRQANVGPGQALNFGAGDLLAKGAAFARAMGVPFFDNTYFSSDAPIKPV